MMLLGMFDDGCLMALPECCVVYIFASVYGHTFYPGFRWCRAGWHDMHML